MVFQKIGQFTEWYGFNCLTARVFVLPVPAYYTNQIVLTKEPNLGTWSIIASVPANDIEEVKQFRVEEYGTV